MFLTNFSSGGKKNAKDTWTCRTDLLNLRWQRCLEVIRLLNARTSTAGAKHVNRLDYNNGEPIYKSERIKTTANKKETSQT